MGRSKKVSRDTMVWVPVTPGISKIRRRQDCNSSRMLRECGVIRRTTIEVDPTAVGRESWPS